MDTLTQVALGAAIGDAGFSRRMGNRAVVFGGVMGLIPDLDLASSLLGDWASLVHHRGWSHSLIVLTLASPILGWVGWRIGRRRSPWLAWWLLAFLGLVTHPLLDVCTSYGTMLLVPLSRERFAIDAIGIVDLLYSVPLVAALVWSWRARSRGGAGGRVTTGALVLSSVVLLGGLGITLAVEARARSQLAPEGVEVVAVRATPPPVFTPLRRVLVRDEEGALHVATASLWTPRPWTFTTYPRSDDPHVVAALGSEKGRIFQWFTDGWTVARVEPGDGDTHVVRVSDMRYGMVTEKTWSPFGVVFHVHDDGEVASAELTHARGDLDVAAELSAMLELTLGRPGP